VLRVWIVVAARAQSIVANIAAWAKLYDLDLTTTTDGIVLDVRARGFRRHGVERSDATQAKLDGALLADASAISMVVRDARRIKTSAWHKETLADPARALAAVERVVMQPQETYARAPKKNFESLALDMREILLSSIEGNVRAELTRTVLDAMAKNARAGAARAVLDDVLQERLPPLLGRDFDVDVVLREAIATARGLSSTTIAMRNEFYVESERRMSAANTTTPRGTAMDWSSVSAVRAAIETNTLKGLAFSIDEKNPEHAKTLLALTPEERLVLAKKNGLFATHMANVATHFLARRQFVEALALYDAALEAELPSGVLANPLYAIQNDNNHLGIDVVRSRRYLERCLVGTPEENPAIFLNASFVCMEVGDHDEAIRMLTLAKEHGIRVKPHRNEGLFVPLRERADFVKLMK
jgi:hypothetical protein